MRVIVRGIPNFAHVQIHEVSNLEAFVNEHELRVRRRLVTPGYEGHYYRQTPEGKSRVMLYLEGVEENRRLLTERCFKPNPNLHLSALVISLNEDQRLKSFGTTGRLELGQGNWYMLEPNSDQRWERLWVKAKADHEEQLRLQRLADEREEEQRQQIDNLIDALGYDEALRRLTGE